MIEKIRFIFKKLSKFTKNSLSNSLKQIEYADMLKRVEPLRDELQSLEDQAAMNMKNAQDTKDLIAQLEQSIAAYKEEYAQLISQAQAIKTDLENVQAKVDRSTALLKSLNIESERWEATSETFRSQMSTIIGDVLLSAAFIAYGKSNTSIHPQIPKVIKWPITFISKHFRTFFQVVTLTSTTVAVYFRHGVNIYKPPTSNIDRILHVPNIYQIPTNVCVGKLTHCPPMIYARRMQLC